MVSLLSFALAAVFATAAQAQPVRDLFDTDRFHGALLDERTGEVTFKPFQELDWEAKARTALGWLNLDRPTPEQMARLATNEGAGPQYRYVDFRAPLEPAVSRATYVLICATGVVRLQPVELEGTVGFFFDAGMFTVERRFFSGAIVGKPPHPVTSAAFVVMGKPGDVGGVNPNARFERRKQAGPAVYDFADGRGTITWATSSKDCADPAAASRFECLDTASALSFELAGQHLLLVRWAGAFCDSSYTLFAVNATLKPIASDDYGCDM